MYSKEDTIKVLSAVADMMLDNDEVAFDLSVIRLLTGENLSGALKLMDELMKSQGGWLTVGEDVSSEEVDELLTKEIKMRNN